METLLDAALGYAKRGWPVFPCDSQKRPLTPHGFKDASTASSQIEAWWSQWPHAMIGVPTGELTGFWALDVDDPAEFEAAYPGTVPATRRCSAGKGYHLHFAWDPISPMRNSQRSLRGWPHSQLPGAEVRGEGGYVIVPPSIHPSGRRYHWDHEGEVLRAPAELLSLLKSEAPQFTAPRVIPGSPEEHLDDAAAALAALARECEFIKQAPNGAQEKALNDGALKVGKFVGRGELSLSRATESLIEAGLELVSYDRGNPWTAKQVQAKVTRALQDGIRMADIRRVIKIRPGALHEMATEAEKALIEGAAPFYVRAGIIVRPVVEETAAARSQVTKVARVVPVDAEMIQDHLSRTSIWLRFQQREGRDELGSGDHDTPAQGMCIMELITWLSGEPHSDRPLSVCPVLRGFAMALNDGISSSKLRSDLLLPLLPLLIGSRDERLMKPRADLLSVLAVREAVPLLADAMGLYAVADACRSARDRPAALSAALLGRNDSIYSEAVAAASSPEDPEMSALWPNAVEKRGGYAGTVFARTFYQLQYDHTSQLDDTTYWTTATDCLRQAASIELKIEEVRYPNREGQKRDLLEGRR